MVISPFVTSLTLTESTGRDHDSVFEEQVAKALQQRGYQVHRQVGLAGFFIDLAVADADHPGRYLIGIECDGASYHGSRSARDRNRLRQSVLESHGWIIARVWSTDWLQRLSQEIERLVALIEAAKNEAASPGRRVGNAVPYEIVTIERDDVTEIGIEAASAGRIRMIELRIIKQRGELQHVHDQHDQLQLIGIPVELWSAHDGSMRPLRVVDALFGLVATDHV